jgi:manganese transport protein
LPANLLPLVLLTSRRAVMGRLVNARVTTVVAGLATTVIIVLDVFLLVLLFNG